MIIITIIVIITTETVSIAMMTVMKEVQVIVINLRLQETTKHLQVEVPVHLPALRRAVRLLEVIRRRQAEKAQVHIESQVQENPNTKILIEELQKTLFEIGFLLFL